MSWAHGSIGQLVKHWNIFLSYLVYSFLGAAVTKYYTVVAKNKHTKKCIISEFWRLRLCFFWNLQGNLSLLLPIFQWVRNPWPFFAGSNITPIHLCYQMVFSLCVCFFTWTCTYKECGLGVHSTWVETPPNYISK